MQAVNVESAFLLARAFVPGTASDGAAAPTGQVLCTDGGLVMR